MLIDRTYFVGELNIPNTDQLAVSSLTDLFIEKYEERFLKTALGYSLYKAFKAGLQEMTIAQKWIDLRDGVEYVSLSGKTIFYRGLISQPSILVPPPSAPSDKQSPIANYVYYWFIINSHTQTSSMGEKKSQTENAVSISPNNKLVRAWNEMHQWVGELICFLNTKSSTYSEWDSTDQWFALRMFRQINELGI